MLKEGSKAPDFVLATNNGKKISLASLTGKKVVLYFYPKADTPGCTMEAKDFAANLKNFEKANTVVIGVSRDTAKANSMFAEKYCLPFELGCDEDGKVSDAYGVWVEKSMYGKKYMGIERTTFLIDENGKLVKIWPKVKVEGHVQDVLATINR